METVKIVSFYARRLVIIDSVKKNEWESGKMLYNRISEWPDTTVKLDCKYKNIRTASEFKSYLEELQKSVNSEGVPILHISMHGDENGLQLSSGECIDWEELTPSIVQLNIATKNNLLITMAACYGLFITFVNSTKYDRSAFWCVLGRSDSHSGGDFTNDYERFYRTLLQSSNFGDAILAINGANEKNYQIYSGVLLFKKTAEMAIEYFISNDEEHSLVRKLMTGFRKRKYPIPHKEAKAMVRSKLIDSLHDWRKKFFLIDYFPENEERFLSTEQLDDMIQKAIKEKKIMHT